MSTLKEQIAELRERADLMEHFENGGLVCERRRGFNHWNPCLKPGWDWPRSDYRRHVEPKVPLEGWVNVYHNGSVLPCYHSTKEQADKLAAANRIACIHMREVMEGES